MLAVVAAELKLKPLLALLQLEVWVAAVLVRLAQELLLLVLQTQVVAVVVVVVLVH
jgi:hypothetical protein